MRWSAFFFLLPTLAWSVVIPVDVFDQQKLETLLRNIPSALVKSEKLDGFVRKFYEFPKTENPAFKISCYADYFGDSSIPSLKICELKVLSPDKVGDEYLIQLNDKVVVDALYKGISYGAEVKKFYSTQRFYGMGHDGVSKNLFRYSFICKSGSCDITFAAK